jgi:TolB-like protein
VALIVLTAALFYSLRSKSKELGPTAAPREIAVLPFRPISAEGRDEYLELGMADALITKLSNLNQLVVRSTGAVRKYSGQDQDPVAIGQEQQVEAVLLGNVQRLGERIRVTVQLVRVQDGRPLWAGKFDEQFTDIFAVQDAISDQIMRELAVQLTGAERERLAKRRTENAQANLAYMRGRFFWNKRTEEGYYKATEHFRQAIAADPNFGLAYAGLADTYHLLGDYSSLPPREIFPRATEARWPRRTRRWLMSGFSTTGTGRRPRASSAGR